MNRLYTILFIFVICIRSFYCIDVLKPENLSDYWEQKFYKSVLSYTGELSITIPSDQAEEIIAAKSELIMTMISEKDFKKMSEYIHPELNCRFSPYKYVRINEDRILTAKQIENFFDLNEKVSWGEKIFEPADFNPDEPYIPKDIMLTNLEYYDRYIYIVDYINESRWIGYNLDVSISKLRNNQDTVYPDSISVEYYYEDPDPEDVHFDWHGLKLVFKEYEGDWYLCGIINSEFIY